MGILMGIVSFFLGLFINFIDWLVVALMGSIGYSMTTFLEIFPFADVASGVFTALGLLFLCAGLVWNLAKGTVAPFGVEYENPIHVIGKVILAWFVVINLPDIIDIVIQFFQITLNYVEDLPLGPSVMDQENWASTMVASLVIDGVGLKNGFLAIIYIIAIIMLGYRFILLLGELVERYIVYCFICLIGPLFVSTAAFKGSRDIASTWMRAFAGQSLLILLNTLTVRMFLSYCQVLMENLGGMVVESTYIPVLSILMFGYAFLSFATRLDTLLRIAGLNTAHTGPNLVSSLGSGFSHLLSSARVANAAGGIVGTMGAAARSAGSYASRFASAAGNAVGNMNAAARSAGGYRTVSGIKAAVSSMSNDITNGVKSGASKVASQAGSKLGLFNTMRHGNGNAMFSAGFLLRSGDSAASQVMKGQQAISNALQRRANTEDTSNGLGITAGLKGTAAKTNYVNGGVLASAGEQNELANKHYGNPKNMGKIHQSSLTTSAVRAAATSAERITSGNGKYTPVASYRGPEAAAAMNGVTAFDNPHLKEFTFTDDGDSSFISGQKYEDDSFVTFDSVEGGIATGVYTDEDGNSVAFKMVHTNAVDSQEAIEGAGRFDRSRAVGMVGDGTGKSGYYVIPMEASDTDSTTIPFGRNQSLAEMHATVDPEDLAAVSNAQRVLRHFVEMNNPVNKTVRTIDSNRAGKMKDEAVGSVPGYGSKVKR